MRALNRSVGLEMKLKLLLDLGIFDVQLFIDNLLVFCTFNNFVALVGSIVFGG